MPSRYEHLCAMRDRVAAAVYDDKTRPADLASLTRRLMDIIKEIEAIDATSERDVIGNAADTPDETWPGAFERR